MYKIKSKHSFIFFSVKYINYHIIALCYNIFVFLLIILKCWCTIKKKLQVVILCKFILWVQMSIIQMGGREIIFYIILCIIILSWKWLKNLNGYMLDELFSRFKFILNKRFGILLIFCIGTLLFSYLYYM